MRTIDIVAVILLIIGGLNWGLVGIAHFDLVATLFGLKFGQTNMLSSIVYILVALAALVEIVSLTTMRKTHTVTAGVR